MRIIENNDRYILPSTLNQCFESGKTIHVDKVLTGNGFTTAFLKETPPENKINILIAPNKSVVIGKEISNKYNSILYGNNRIKFFYKESSEVSVKNADTLVFVADSFLMYAHRLEAIKDRINRVLIDEYHSTQIQSSYRLKLVDFLPKVRAIIGQKAPLTTVTATPLLFSKVDVKIINKDIPKRVIQLVNNQDENIKEATELIEQGKNVLIACNSASILYRFKDKNNEIRANWHVGDDLLRNASELAIIKQDAESNLTVISSRGFEGVDVYGNDYHVYFFEDRGNKHECFYLANLYQAINRCRDSIKAIKYVRMDLNSQRRIYFANIENSIERFVTDTKISVEKKQNSRYKEYHPFVIFEAKKGNYGFNIKPNYDAINLYKERLLWDNPFSTEFNEFLEERNIEIIDNRQYVPNRIRKVKPITKTKVNNLLSNTQIIEQRDLYGSDYKFSVNQDVSRKDALKLLKTYLRRKNYNSSYILTSKQKTALVLLENDKIFYKHRDKIVSLYAKRKREKHSRRDADIKIEQFKMSVDRVFLHLICAFVNATPYIKKKIIGYRDYNILTEVSYTSLEYVSSLFLYEAYECDIKTCNSRIAYAYNHLDLPNDFYGGDKVNKRAINKHLNDFMLNINKGTDYYLQRNQSEKKFNELGFHSDVSRFMIKNFFDAGHRDSVFNFFAYHEKNIIEKLQLQLKSIGVNSIRRHDSIIIFRDRTDIDFNLDTINDIVRDFTYLNRGGWFDEIGVEKGQKVLT